MKPNVFSLYVISWVIHINCQVAVFLELQDVIVRFFGGHFSAILQ